MVFLRPFRLGSRIQECLHTRGRYTPGGGGGGYLEHILVGMCPATPKKGVLGAGRAPKKGVSLMQARPEKGGLRCIYNSKKGEFRTGFVNKEGVRN